MRNEIYASRWSLLTFLPSSVEDCDLCRLVCIGLGGFLSVATLTFALACSWPALTSNQFCDIGPT